MKKKDKIKFKTQMIERILDGSKTHTRRIIFCIENIFTPNWEIGDRLIVCDEMGLQVSPSLKIEIIDLCIQRLNDISEEDARREGFPDPQGLNIKYPDRARYWFRGLWNDIYSEDKTKQWDANPYVWVYSFKKAEGDKK
jgi:uncharacterized protein YhfF